MSTQSQYHLTVSVDGKSIGVFDRLTGGDISAENVTRQTGEGRKVYPAKGKPSDLTVVRGFERVRDWELVRQLEKRAGIATMTVTEQPLDEDGNAWGRPKTKTGILNSVNGGEVDKDSDEPRDLELGMIVKEF